MKGWSTYCFPESISGFLFNAGKTVRIRAKEARLSIWVGQFNHCYEPRHKKEGSLKVRRIPLSKALLAQMAESERSFLLLAGHIQNELTSLHKVFAWCLHGNCSSESSAIESLVNGVQAQIYARLLAGKLFEAWLALKASFFGSKLSCSIEGKLHPNSQDSLKAIKTYFNKSNNIFRVRNSFAFHYSVEEFTSHWREPADEPNFELILGGTVGNNFALASELVVLNAVLNSINPADKAAALQKFFDEVQSLAEHFTIFLEGALIALLEEATQSKFSNLQHEDQEIVLQEGWGDVGIPHFYHHDLPK